MFVLLNMFIAILTEAYEKSKIEVFGDIYHRQVGMPRVRKTLRCL
jgi:hypothetical protein